MRLPNSYGSVTKLSGARRNPWVVRKTIGYDDNGKQLRKVIGYYPTRAKALQALADFNDAPYNLDNADITFAELYKKWMADKFDDDANRSTVKNYGLAYNHCKRLEKRKFKDIRTFDIQSIMDDCPAGYQTASRIKTLFKQLYTFALQHDIVTKDYTEGIRVKQKNDPKKRDRFSSEELKMLWSEKDENEFVPFILIMIYSGCRIGELLALEKKDVHLDDQYFDVIKSKTAAGVRKVPIADKVLPFWKAYYEKSKISRMFTNLDGNLPLSDDNFRRRYWTPLCQRLGMEHTPHETRHTCISMLTTANVNPTFIKFIVGHKSMMDLTEKTYTHIEIKDLLDAINRI